MQRPWRFGSLYRAHFSDVRRERLFLASLAFFLAFAIVRAVTHAIRAGEGPLHDLSIGSTHVHHLVWGILLLLLVGYLWLVEVGSGRSEGARWSSRLTATLYGVGAALTLDEFALWLKPAGRLLESRRTGERRRRGAVRRAAVDRALGDALLSRRGP